MPNQFTTDPYAKPRPSAFDYLSGQGGAAPMQRTLGQSVNEALPNLDPGKMGMVDRVASRSQMPATSTVRAPATSGPQTFEEFYGQQAPGAREDALFSQQGADLRGRASGKRSSTQIASDLQYEEQERERARSATLRMLAGRGFAPSSALGLQYERDVDRNVSELMERRRATREQQAQEQYIDFLAQAEQRRRDREAERLAQAQLEQQQAQFTTEQKRKRRLEPLEWISRIAGGFATLFPGGK